MMATVRHVTAWVGRTKFQTDGFLFVGVYINVTARYHKILLCPFLTSKPFVWLLQLQTF